eukprot:m.188162 g.188162  ORF g.188162 m.188162 type:complete len:701 (+) comp21639_c0_seq2:33-2135(+)
MAAPYCGRYEWVISFNEKLPHVNDVLRYCVRRLQAASLLVQQDDADPSLVRVGATLEELEHRAEQIALRKRVIKPELGVETEEFSIENRESFEAVGTTSFFTPAERALLVGDILDEISPDEELITILQKHHSESASRTGQGSEHKSLLEVLKHAGVTDFDGPIHDTAPRFKLFWDMLRPFEFARGTATIHNIRDYYGEGVAYYFGWMRFFTLSLTVPGMLGVALWALTPQGWTVDNNPYVPVFSIAVVLWGFLFVKGWARCSTEYAFLWDTVDSAKTYQQVRPSFYGDERTDPVTGRTVLHYARWKRRCKYGVSVLVTLVMLAVAFAVMVGSLNLQGYIHEKDRFGDDNPFHIPFLYQFSREGAVFDPNGNIVLSLVPVVLHSMVILFLNQFIYRRIAEALSEWENHRTEQDFENSLIVKRFLFEAFDCYIALFYLAFYECDVIRLRSELQALYMTDTVRRVLLETALPTALHVFSHRQAQKKAAAAAKKDKDIKSTKASLGVTLQEVADNDREMDMYEQFDDYLEMVIEFGYVTMFASAFPMAAAISVLANSIEMRSDSVKLAIGFRRPRIARVGSMGAWESILRAQVWLAVLTNVFIFGFTSEQMMQYLPEFFERVYLTHGQAVAIAEQTVAEGAGRYVVAIVFLLEHVLILVGIGLDAAIHTVPKWVRTALQKREYLAHSRYLEMCRQQKLARAKAA